MIGFNFTLYLLTHWGVAIAHWVDDAPWILRGASS